MTPRLLLPVITALGLIGFAAPPAQAQAQASRAVAYGDLDLASEAGIARLDHRLAQAAKAVCHTGDPTLRARLAERRCRLAARRDAAAQRGLAIARSGRTMAVNTVAPPRSGG